MNEENGLSPLAGFMKASKAGNRAPHSAGSPPSRSTRIAKRYRVPQTAIQSAKSLARTTETASAPSSKKQQEFDALTKTSQRKLARFAFRHAQRKLFEQMQNGKLAVPERALPDNPPDGLASRLLRDDRVAIGDAKLVSDAIDKRWPMSKAAKAAVMERVISRGINTTDNHLLMRVFDAMLKAERQNQEDEHKSSNDPATQMMQSVVKIYLPDNQRGDALYVDEQ